MSVSNLTLVYNANSILHFPQQVCLSIQSMLASSPKKEKPEGDDKYSKTHPRGTNPKLTTWLYDDDKC